MNCSYIVLKEPVWPVDLLGGGSGLFPFGAPPSDPKCTRPEPFVPDRRGRQIAQSGLGHGGKYRNIRLIHGSCQAGPGRDRSLFLDSLLADQSMEQSHKPPGGTGHSCPLPHTPAISSVAYTRGAAGSWSSASRLVFAYTPRRRWGPTGSQRRRPTDVHTATTTHLNFVQV